MATITSNAIRRRMQLRDQLKTALSGCRDMLDAFVSNRMRYAAAEAEHVQPRQVRSAPPSTQAEAPSLQFEPLGSDVISDAIPAFYIGRNRAGLWVARDARGRIGGIFLLKNSALSFAQAQNWPQRCATIFPAARFELDLANAGNQLAPQLAAIMTGLRRRLAATFEGTAQQFKRFGTL